MPHQDEIGPLGARMFGIEVEHSWQRSVADCSGTLAVAYDFEGGPALWLALKLYAGTRTLLDPPDPPLPLPPPIPPDDDPPPLLPSP